MPEAIITVRGEHTSTHPAEQATVLVSAQFDGPDREQAIESATVAASEVRASFDEVADRNPTAIVRWSSDSLRVWAERPWNNEGAQLPLVFHAVVDISVVFGDLGAVAPWLRRSAGTDGVSVSSIAWDLSEESRRAAVAAARVHAVEDAASKAADYARAVGLTRVTAVAVADSGMLDGAGEHAPQPVMERTAMTTRFDGSDPLALELHPSDVVIAGSVDARFVAS